MPHISETSRTIIFLCFQHTVFVLSRFCFRSAILLAPEVNLYSFYSLTLNSLFFALFTLCGKGDSGGDQNSKQPFDFTPFALHSPQLTSLIKVGQFDFPRAISGAGTLGFRFSPAVMYDFAQLNFHAFLVVFSFVHIHIHHEHSTREGSAASFDPDFFLPQADFTLLMVDRIEDTFKFDKGNPTNTHKSN